MVMYILFRVTLSYHFAVHLSLCNTQQHPSKMQKMGGDYVLICALKRKVLAGILDFLNKTAWCWGTLCAMLCCAVLCCAVLCCAPSLQSCLIPCFPMDCSTQGSSVHGILQQEYWSGLSCTPPGDLPNPGIKCRSPALQTDSLPLRHWESPLVPSTHHKTEKDKQ